MGDSQYSFSLTTFRYKLAIYLLLLSLKKIWILKIAINFTMIYVTVMSQSFWEACSDWTCLNSCWIRPNISGNQRWFWQIVEEIWLLTTFINWVCFFFLMLITFGWWLQLLMVLSLLRRRNYRLFWLTNHLWVNFFFPNLFVVSSCILLRNTELELWYHCFTDCRFIRFSH